jgi:signal peptidase
VIRRLADHLTLAAVVVVLVAWAVFLRPVALGGGMTYMVTRGDSMSPTYQNSDFVVLRAEPAYHVGEVVAYRVPEGQIGAGQLVIHRIVGGTAQSGLTLKGDNNPAPDPWHPTSTDVAGKAVMHVPVIGRVLIHLRQPALLAAVAATLFVMFVITWSPSNSQPDDRSRRERGATWLAQRRGRVSSTAPAGRRVQ